jgi:hypothetical protein
VSEDDDPGPDGGGEPREEVGHGFYRRWPACIVLDQKRMTKYQVPSTKYQVPSTKYQVPMKSEARNPKQARIYKHEFISTNVPNDTVFSSFEFCASNLFRASSFGFRIWDAERSSTMSRVIRAASPGRVG